MYSGLVYRNDDELDDYSARYDRNVSLSDDERRAARKYALGVFYTGAQINIPVDMDKPGMYVCTENLCLRTTAHDCR